MSINSILNFVSNFPVLPVIFAIVFLVFWIYVFFIIYHLTRFGIGTKPKIIAFIFFIGSAFLFMQLVYSFNQIDFKTILGNFNPDSLLKFPKPNF